MLSDPASSMHPTHVLVLGAGGMLGHAVLRYFAGSPGFSVAGSIRSPGVLNHLPRELHEHVVSSVDVENLDALIHLLARAHPSVVINCVGLVKQLTEANEPLRAIPINALLPHRLARLCDLAGARLIHVSTDCVFAGTKGGYTEDDESDAEDLYGRSKFLGEVDYPHAVTLRTSIIGHELNSAHGLIAWFLAQSGEVKGYTRAVFSGLPTVELARVMRDYVIPRPELHGTFHVSSEPINKHDLLQLVAKEYGRSIVIKASDDLVIDRSLDSSRFRRLTGYIPPSWPDLIAAMRRFG